MTKNSIQQFSTTPASNTDIAGINVNTGWPPSNVGIAYRTLMAFLADSLVPLSLSVTGETTVTLTAAQAAAMYAVFTGALTADCTITIPNALFLGYVQNTTTGGHNIILTSGGGTTAVIAPGSAWYVYECDGAGNVALVNLPGSGNVRGPTGAIAGDIVSFNGTSGQVVQDSGLSVSAISPTVATIAALQAATSVTLSQTQCYVLGYSSNGDGGEGVFVVGAAATANGGTIINDASGRSWHRETEGLPYSVKWFGAKWNGTTDDGPAISATIAAAAATISGDAGVVVYLPEGQTLIETPVVYAGQNLLIQGAGGFKTLVINGTAASPAISFSSTSTQFHNGIQGVGFGQSSSVTPTPSSSNAGLNLTFQGQFIANDIQVLAAPAPLLNGINLANCSQIMFSQLQLEGCSAIGFFAISCTDIYISQSRADANADGWVFNACAGMYLSDVTAFGNTGVAWTFQASGATGCENLFATNCVGDTSKSYNWQLFALKTAWLVNCWGSSQSDRTSFKDAPGFIIDTNACAAIYFIGGGAFNNNGSGVFIDNTSGSPKEVQFHGFMFGSDATIGQGNGTGADGGYGLSVTPGATEIYVQGGMALGNVTGAVADGSGGGLTCLQLLGYLTQSSGQGTILSGTSSITVAHNLAATPLLQNIIVTPAGSWFAASVTAFWVSAVSSTTFTISVDANTTANWTFSWTAYVRNF